MKKLLAFSAVINALQVAAAAALAALAFAFAPWRDGDYRLTLYVAAAGAAALAGVFIGITHTRAVHDLLSQTEALLATSSALESLNVKLRAQRHDFMNHLQVTGSLLELGDHTEALAYIEKIYGDIQAMGQNLRTSVPAVNALLMVKREECEKRGILVDIQITDDWNGLSIAGWEMCRILGNLMDNARDALEGAQSPWLRVHLYGELDRHCFNVANNGPTIPAAAISKLFESGYTTKPGGQGLGLGIVRGILERAGGGISVESDASATAFKGWVPCRRGD